MFASDFRAVNAELDQLTRDITTKSGQLEEARETYLNAKAAYEFRLNGQRLEAKAKDPDATQTDVNAQAAQMAHILRLEMIKAECSMRKLASEIRAHRDRLEALREVSFNLRKEASL